MRARVLLLPALLVISLIVALVATDSSAPTKASVTLDPEEEAFMTLINDYRQQNGLQQLSINVEIQAAAEWMSADMGENRYFSHTDSLGRTPWERMADFGYDYNTWKGENIAAGFTTAQSVFTAWKNSDGHNANMLNANYKVMGIAREYTAGSPYGYYWTNDFGGYAPPGPPPSTATPTPSPAPTPVPTPLPDDPDDDGDGFTNATELHVGTNPNKSCGDPDTSKPGHPSLAWPADLVTTKPKVTLEDITSFVFPSPSKLNTSSGDAGWDQRYDLVPSGSITVNDMMALLFGSTAYPPMFEGQWAFNGPECVE